MRVHSTRSSTRQLGAIMAVSALAFAACSGSTSPAPSTAALPSLNVVLPSAAPSEAASAAATDTPAPSTVESAEPSAVATDVDPCQLITADEAGQLAGTSFGPGKESTTQGNARICTYGAQTKNVFMVDLAIAPSAEIAKADETAVLAELQQQAAAAGKNAVQTSAVQGFAPNTDAVIVKMGPILGINGAAIYLLRGTTFFGFSDLVVGGNAPTIDDVKAKAMDVLNSGKLP